MLLFSFPAIIMNIGADIAGMGAVGNLLFPTIEANYLIYGIKKPNMISFINPDSQHNIKNSF